MKRDPVKVFADGREVCNQRTAAGKFIYEGRLTVAHFRQGGICCLYGHAPMCRKWLDRSVATFEHQDGRGMNGGHRDDRIELPDGTWINGAAHPECNNWKGSRRIDYNSALPAVPPKGARQ